MGKVIKEFKNKVPCSSKMKKIVGFNNKNNQIKLLVELKKEILEMTEDNCINKKTINNIFEYLMGNIVSKDYLYLKNVVNILVKLTYDLENRIICDLTCCDSNLGKCYIDILEQIKLFEKVLAKRLDKKDEKELENIILFEKLTYIILEKRDIQTSIQCINENSDLLNYHNYEGKDFEHLLFERYEHAKIINDLKSLTYYTGVISYIMHYNIIKINNKKFNKIIYEDKNSLKSPTILDKKLKSLDYDLSLGRFILHNQLIVSIDSNGTRNIDDALSIERLDDGGFILGVHIADVCSLTDYNEQMLTGKKFPSYNYSLASLEQKKPKNAVSLFVQIDKDGNINDYRIVKSNIIVSKNLYHYDIKKISSNKNNNDITNFVTDLKDLYMLFGDKDIYNLPSYKIGELIVEKYMKLFGCLVSNHFSLSNLPYIYLNKIDDITTYSLYDKKYNTGFEDQGLYTYGKSTSPIIDLSSRVNQFLIHEYLFHEADDRKIYKIEDKLDDIVEKLNRIRIETIKNEAKANAKKKKYTKR